MTGSLPVVVRTSPRGLPLRVGCHVGVRLRCGFARIQLVAVPGLHGIQVRDSDRNEETSFSGAVFVVVVLNWPCGFIAAGLSCETGTGSIPLPSLQRQRPRHHGAQAMSRLWERSKARERGIDQKVNRVMSRCSFFTARPRSSPGRRRPTSRRDARRDRRAPARRDRRGRRPAAALRRASSASSASCATRPALESRVGFGQHVLARHHLGQRRAR